MEEVIVRIVSMPVGVKGITLLDDDWNFNVYINANLSKSEQQATLEHELEHIKKGDWQRLNYMTVCQIESEIGA